MKFKTPAMNRVSSCRALFAIAACVGFASCGAVGCAVNGKSVSVDSNSRIPFFGLELKERSRKSAGPPIHSIRADGQSDVRVEPLGLVKGVASLSRLSEVWDRKSPSLPTIALPMSGQRLGVDAPVSRSCAEIDFRE